MDDQRRALWISLGGFTVVCLLLAWSFIYRTTKTFSAGTRPANQIKTTNVTPKMPPLRQSDPSRGSTSTEAIVIVQFSDYACEFCRAITPEIDALVRSYPDTVKHVWRDLPVTSDRPDSMLAALAGRCAKDQNAFWQMNRELLQMSVITIDEIERVAERLRLDPQSFKNCITSGDYITDIQQDIQIAKDHGVTGVPTLFIGDDVLTGYVKATDLQWAIFKNRLF